MSDTEKPSWEWQQEVARLQEQLEAQAWTISPAMAQAQIHQLNLKIIQLEEWVAIGNATRDALRQQLADMTQERDEAVRIAKELVGLAPITDADIRWAEALLAAQKHQEGLP